MNNVITIIGKNSNLYRCLDMSILKDNFNLVELSHKDVNELELIYNPVIFSYSKNIYENAEFMKIVLSKVRGKIIYISSIATLIVNSLKTYNYPNVKYKAEEFILSDKNNLVLRIGIVEDLINVESHYHGEIKVSNCRDITLAIKNGFTNENMVGIQYATSKKLIRGNLIFRFIYAFQTLTLKVSPILFFFFRPLDFVYKMFGYYNYGYTFLANKF